MLFIFQLPKHLIKKLYFFISIKWYILCSKSKSVNTYFFKIFNVLCFKIHNFVNVWLFFSSREWEKKLCLTFSMSTDSRIFMAFKIVAIEISPATYSMKRERDEKKSSFNKRNGIQTECKEEEKKNFSGLLCDKSRIQNEQS